MMDEEEEHLNVKFKNEIFHKLLTWNGLKPTHKQSKWQYKTNNLPYSPFHDNTKQIIRFSVRSKLVIYVL
jgi:hypothetical protein